LVIASVIDRFHRTLAKSPMAVAFACKLRNQCARIIQCHLGPSTSADRNGEEILIHDLASHLLTVFDVGANKGEWSRVVRAQNSSTIIHQFECNPALMKKLRDDFAGDQGIVLHQCALGDTEGRRTFFSVDASSELGSLIRPDESSHYSVAGEVPVRTIDGICAELRIENIDLLKVDTEGYDFHVLLGASEMISRQRVMVIQFEYGNGWARAGSTLFRCLEWLSERSYQVFLMTPDGHRPFDYATWGEFLGYSNFVAYAPRALGFLANPTNTALTGPSTKGAELKKSDRQWN
jgi:FkbM family methyltransferase